MNQLNVAPQVGVEKRHTLSVLVQDVDGIISRIAGMFTRRGFPMYSFSSARTEVEGIQRITVVAYGDEVVVQQITKQLNKLVDVLKVVRLDEDTTIARAMLLVKVSADNTTRPHVVDAANIFRARIVDVAPESVVIEATGTPGKLGALLDVLEPFGIREYLHSGEIALSRGPKTMFPQKS
ncbi:acetolactate synthase small subunit [Staphylococcus chromogenes]|nr:acetolactate synthase small subunit [Staphylococcus chromogenes]